MCKTTHKEYIAPVALECFNHLAWNYLCQLNSHYYNYSVVDHCQRYYRAQPKQIVYIDDVIRTLDPSCWEDRVEATCNMIKVALVGVKLQT